MKAVLCSLQVITFGFHNMLNIKKKNSENEKEKERIKKKQLWSFSFSTEVIKNDKWIRIECRSPDVCKLCCAMKTHNFIEISISDLIYYAGQLYNFFVKKKCASKLYPLVLFFWVCITVSIVHDLAWPPKL